MGKQEKFYDWSNEPPPRNRRIYAAAKVPFGYLWEFVCWLGLPWLQALPIAFVAATVLKLFAFGLPSWGAWSDTLYDVMTVGLLWTFYLGAVFAAVKVLRCIFE